MFPKPLIANQRRNIWAVLRHVAAAGKPYTPNVNTAALEEHSQSTVFNRNLKGPMLSGILETKQSETVLLQPAMKSIIERNPSQSSPSNHK
jgi:hypothetical protein